MLLAISCPWMTPPPANLLRAHCSTKCGAGRSQAFHLFLGEGWRCGGGGRHRPLSGNYLGGSCSSMLTPSAGGVRKNKTRIHKGVREREADQTFSED